MGGSLAPGGGRHHFLRAVPSAPLAIVLGPMADNGTMSSIASASSRFSLAFSSSGALSRLASDGFTPPNFAFQA